MEFLSTLLSGTNLALIGAFLAVGLAGVGSARGVGMVGQAGTGLLSEDPDSFGPVLVLEALPATQGVYGLIAALMVMIRLNMFGTPIALSQEHGMYFLIACLPIAIVGLISATHQAKVAVGGIHLVAKQKGALGKAITSAALVETYAIFALLVSLMLIIIAPV